jgi:hypothetical protein
MKDETCEVFAHSAVDDWAKKQHNFQFEGDRCPKSPYMTLTESEHVDPTPVCKVHGEAWLGNEKDVRIVNILVATPEEVAAAITSIQGGRLTT